MTFKGTNVWDSVVVVKLLLLLTIRRVDIINGTSLLFTVVLLTSTRGDLVVVVVVIIWTAIDVVEFAAAAVVAPPVATKPPQEARLLASNCSSAGPLKHLACLTAVRRGRLSLKSQAKWQGSLLQSIGSGIFLLIHRKEIVNLFWLCAFWAYYLPSRCQLCRCFLM